MPQEAWSQKDERMYEEIKQDRMDDGVGEERAEEIAARTVNKKRREEGRTKSDRESTSGTGNPNQALEDRIMDELYNRAQELDIEGRSDMDKDELVRAIRNEQ